MALLDGILGCWSPPLAATGYTLLDRSAYRRHATLQNMDAGTDWVATPYGLALDFDGIDDQINTGTSIPEIQRGSEVSLSIWGARATTTSRLFFGRNGFNTIYISLWSDGAVYTVNAGSSIAFADSRTSWTHWCMTQGSGTQRLYRNGVQVASVAATGQDASTSTFVIGGLTSLPGQGRIGECVVWGSELKAADVLEVYKRGSGAMGRILTGQTRRRVYGTGARFKAAWARGSNVLLGFNQP